MQIAATSERSYYSGWARVHDAFWPEDQARSEQLRRRMAGEPWSDDLPVQTGPECVVCRRPYRPERGAQKVCGRCRSSGWTAATCECGRPLHRREQKSQSGMRGRCGKCRREALADTQPQSASKVIVAEPPPPPLLCLICGGPKASRKGKRCYTCRDKVLCRCGGVMSRGLRRCVDCARYAP